MAENFYTEILFQGLTTGLKTDGDVLRYANALTSLFSASSFNSYKTCELAARSIRATAIAKALAEYAAELSKIQAAFSACLGSSLERSGNTSTPEYIACDNAREAATKAADLAKELAVAKADEDYNAAVAECIKRFGKPRVVTPRDVLRDARGFNPFEQPIRITTGSSPVAPT